MFEVVLNRPTIWETDNLCNRSLIAYVTVIDTAKLEPAGHCVHYDYFTNIWPFKIPCGLTETHLVSIRIGRSLYNCAIPPSKDDPSCQFYSEAVIPGSILQSMTKSNVAFIRVDPGVYGGHVKGVYTCMDNAYSFYAKFHLMSADSQNKSYMSVSVTGNSSHCVLHSEAIAENTTATNVPSTLSGANTNTSPVNIPKKNSSTALVKKTTNSISKNKSKPAVSKKSSTHSNEKDANLVGDPSPAKPSSTIPSGRRPSSQSKEAAPSNLTPRNTLGAGLSNSSKSPLLLPPRPISASPSLVSQQKVKAGTTLIANVNGGLANKSPPLSARKSMDASSSSRNASVLSHNHYNNNVSVKSNKSKMNSSLIKREDVSPNVPQRKPPVPVFYRRPSSSPAATTNANSHLSGVNHRPLSSGSINGSGPAHAMKKSPMIAMSTNAAVIANLAKENSIATELVSVRNELDETKKSINLVKNMFSTFLSAMESQSSCKATRSVAKIMMNAINSGRISEFDWTEQASYLLEEDGHPDVENADYDNYHGCSGNVPIIPRLEVSERHYKNNVLYHANINKNDTSLSKILSLDERDDYNTVTANVNEGSPVLNGTSLASPMAEKSFNYGNSSILHSFEHSNSNNLDAADHAGPRMIHSTPAVASAVSMHESNNASGVTPRRSLFSPSQTEEARAAASTSANYAMGIRNNRVSDAFSSDSHIMKSNSKTETIEEYSGYDVDVGALGKQQQEQHSVVMVRVNDEQTGDNIIVRYTVDNEVIDPDDNGNVHIEHIATAHTVSDVSIHDKEIYLIDERLYDDRAVQNGAILENFCNINGANSSEALRTPRVNQYAAQDSYNNSAIVTERKIILVQQSNTHSVEESKKNQIISEKSSLRKQAEALNASESDDVYESSSNNNIYYSDILNRKTDNFIGNAIHQTEAKFDNNHHATVESQSRRLTNDSQQPFVNNHNRASLTSVSGISSHSYHTNSSVNGYPNLTSNFDGLSKSVVIAKKPVFDESRSIDNINQTDGTVYTGTAANIYVSFDGVHNISNSYPEQHLHSAENLMSLMTTPLN